MNKLSTKLRQKQSIVPQQIIKSRLLELSIDELEKDLENEIQVNPVIEEPLQNDQCNDGYELC